MRVDGGFKTGRDVVIAALLGAESFGFGTAPLVALGCAMARQCHLNTCPTGVATQRPDLRAKFSGTPEQVIAYFTLVAEEVRGHSRRPWVCVPWTRSSDERTCWSESSDPICPGRRCWICRCCSAGGPRATGGRTEEQPRHRRPPSVVRRTVIRNDRPGVVSLDDEILEECQSYIESGHPFSGMYDIRNHHLAVGARVAGAIAMKHGDAGLPAGLVQLRFRGSAGQSFGAFAIRGMLLDLEGEANDYVGKGLSGATISIRPFRQAGYAQATHDNVIIGNTVLYGATSGKLFAAGQAGSRFAVRNSGAVAVIEGAGNHCCEYMTGGMVLVLGPLGRNFGAGMTNGVAYVLDEDGIFPSRLNTEMVTLTAFEERDDSVVQQLIHEHLERTGSPRAKRLFEEWERYRPLFRKVVPNGAASAVSRTTTRESKAESLESRVEGQELKLGTGN